MIRFYCLFVFSFWMCQADIPVTPLVTPPPVLCGYIPDNISTCTGNPQVVQPEISRQCDESTECEKMTCIFRKSGWLTNEKVDKTKVTSYFEQFAKDHSAWSSAVEHAKTACLTEDLKPQGVYLDCPAYDVLFCILTGFIKNTQPSQWSTSENCKYPRQFASACPVCPNDCFAPRVPYGSCNACYLLPRSP